MSAITAGLKEDNLPTELQLSDDCLTQINQKHPYLELIVSKATAGMDILPYNIPIGSMALPIETAMLHAAIRHYLKIFPAGFMCLATGIKELMKLNLEYPLTDHYKGGLAASIAMNKVSDQLMIATAQASNS